MPNNLSYRKPPRTPPGCEDHLTRQQAAQLLGFSSEFKIRQLEREGRLRSVRGPMRTAFYARADVLAVKAQLGRDGLGQETADGWTDAELLLLLGSPNREGRQRSALDLVLETRISIERAEKVFAFWASARPGAVPTAARGQAAGSEAEAARPTLPPPQPPKAATQPPAAAARVESAKPVYAPVEPPQTATANTITERARVEVPSTASSDESERRGEDRLSRDQLIAQLRDPDPRVRDRAFARLKALQGGR